MGFVSSTFSYVPSNSNAHAIQFVSLLPRFNILSFSVLLAHFRKEMLSFGYREQYVDSTLWEFIMLKCYSGFLKARLKILEHMYSFAKLVTWGIVTLIQS